MKAMLLAAGRGERMRPLTDTCPKPLLRAGGTSLIEAHLRALAAAGIRELVINHAHLGAQLEAALGDGGRWGVHIDWSPESPALETAGGIRHALRLLRHGVSADAIFAAIAADIHCDFDYARLPQLADTMRACGDLAHLILVPNPPHHPEGDFVLQAPDRAALEGTTVDSPRFTFSGIGLYHPQLFADLLDLQPHPLAPLLRSAIADGRVGATLHSGRWFDIGTPQRLALLDAELRGEGGTGALATSNLQPFQ